jgi:hypothetical protein
MATSFGPKFRSSSELETYIETKSVGWRSPCFTSKNTLKMYAKNINEDIFKRA